MVGYSSVKVAKEERKGKGKEREGKGREGKGREGKARQRERKLERPG